MDVTALIDFAGVIVGLGLSVPLLVQFVGQVSNKMTLDHANTINQASLSEQSGTSRATKIATST